MLVCWGEEVLWSDGRDECDGRGGVGEGEVFLGYACGGDAADGFAGGAAAAAGGGFDAVLFEVGEVGVRGARVPVHGGVAVVFGALVLVAHDHGDGRAEGEAEFGAGLDLDAVFFVAGGGEGGLAWSLGGRLVGAGSWEQGVR